MKLRSHSAGIFALIIATTLAGCDGIDQKQSTETVGSTAGVVPGSATEPPDAPDNSLILTGQGWGPLTIGMTKAQVIDALGADSEPDAVGGAEPDICEQFRPARAPAGVLVMIESGRLSRLSLVEGSTLKTERGFGVGSTAAEIKSAFGSALSSRPHKYEAAPAEDLFVWADGGGTSAYIQDPDARGIRYEIGVDGKVKAVHAGGPAIQLVEGCS